MDLAEEVLPPMLMENDSHHICYRNVRGCQLLGDVICPSCLAFAHRHNTLHVRIYGATVGNFDSLPIKLRSRVALILATRDNKHQHEVLCAFCIYWGVEVELFLLGCLLFYFCFVWCWINTYPLFPLLSLNSWRLMPTFEICYYSWSVWYWLMVIQNHLLRLSGILQFWFILHEFCLRSTYKFTFPISWYICDSRRHIVSIHYSHNWCMKGQLPGVVTLFPHHIENYPF